MKYSKEQLCTAIRYWTRRLHVLDESISKSIDMLCDEFGDDVVKSNTLTYSLNQHDLEQIYDILNVTLFESQLKPIELRHWPKEKISERLMQNAIESGSYDEQQNADCYGVYSGVCKEVYDKNGKITDIAISKEIIMTNKNYLDHCIFIFAVAVICHEMIHYYDRFSAEFHDKQLRATVDETYDFDSHEDEVFQDMLKKAQENGIRVEKNLANTPYYVANKNARYTLKNVLGEEKSSMSFVNRNEHRITLKGKGSHTFMFAEFD